MPKQLYEITVSAYKQFFVEAESEEAALSHPATEDEQMVSMSGEYDWLHDSTESRAIDPEEEKYIRAHQQKLIAADEP